MKKTLKILAWLVGALLATAIAAAIVIPLVFDPNDYRDQIAAVVKKQTSRELTIAGKIKLSLFPWIGIRLGAVELGNAKGFGKAPFARVGGMEVRVKLLPLLHKKIAMDKVVLQGLELNLSRRSDGSSNWDDLTQPAAGAPAPKPQPAPNEPLAVAGIAVGGIALSEAKLVWDDRQGGVRYAVDHLNLETGPIALQQPVAIRLELNAESSKPELRGHLKFSGTATADLEGQRYRIDDLALAVQLASPLLPGGKADAKLNADITADLKAQTASIAKLKLAAQGLVMEGQLTASEIMQKPAAKAQLRLMVDDPQRLLAPFAAQLPAALKPNQLRQTTLKADFDASLKDQTARLTTLSLDTLGLHLEVAAQAEHILGAPHAKGDLSLQVKDAGSLAPFTPGLKTDALNGSQMKARFDFDQGAQTLALQPLQVAALGVELGAQLRGEHLLDKPLFTGRLKSGEFVPRDIAGRLGIALPTMADPDTLTKASLGFDFDAGLDGGGIKNLRLRLDATTLSGSAAVHNFQAPQIRYDLTIDQADADRYLPPPPPPGAAPPPAATTAQDEAATKLPLKLLRALDIDGTARIGQFKVMNLRSADIRATLKAKDGLFHLYPLGAKLYGGGYDGNVTFDVRGPMPLIGLEEKLAGVQAGPLLKDFMGEDYVSGKANLSAKLSARGIDPLQVRKSLNGTMAFAFTDGMVKGFNLAQVVRNSYAVFQHQPEPKDAVKPTDFSELRGSATITNGLVSNNDLSAKSPLFRVTGQGKVNLVAEELDYLVKAAIVGTLQGAGGKALNELHGLTVPVRINGSFSAPKVGIDWGEVFAGKAGQAVEKEKSKARESVNKAVEQQKQNLQKDLGDQLKNKLKF